MQRVSKYSVGLEVTTVGIRGSKFHWRQEEAALVNVQTATWPESHYAVESEACRGMQMCRQRDCRLFYDGNVDASSDSVDEGWSQERKLQARLASVP